MAKKTKTTEESPDAGVVAAFERVQRELREAEEANPAIFRKLRDLSSRYNSLLDQSHEYVKKSGESCGPFVVSNQRNSYDAESLFNLLGEQEFRRIGGKVEEVKKFSITPQLVAQAVVEGRLEEDAADAFRSVTLTIKRPGKLEIP